ncbi:class I SAM-dependent methyltransferase [Nitrospira sp. Kam-Ns4a]
MNAVVDPRELKLRPNPGLAYAPVERLHPNMSPSVFAALRDAIAARTRPTVLEAGIGISTYHLVAQMRETGGLYVGVEHNRHWFEIVEQWVRRLLSRHAKEELLEERRTVGGLKPMYGEQALLAIETTFRAGALTVRLLLRQCTGQTGDGTVEEFYEYLQALAEPADVAIVDGRARVAVLERLARERLIAPGGLLFLHDARPYRAAALRCFPGGTFLDGHGGFKNALRPDQAARDFVPEEAYLWEAPRRA